MENIKKFDEYFNQNNEDEIIEEYEGLDEETIKKVIKAIEYWKIAYSGVYQQVQWDLTEFNLVDLAKQASISPLLLCQFIFSGPELYKSNISLSYNSPSIKKMTPLEYYTKYKDLIKVVFRDPAKIY